MLFEGMAKVCKEKRLEKDNLRQCTTEVISKIWSPVLEDVDARNVYVKRSCGGARITSDTWWVRQKDEEPSRSRVSVKIASCAQWKTSSGGCPLTTEKAGQTAHFADWWHGERAGGFLRIRSTRWRV